jgi:hypothetical protein
MRVLALASRQPGHCRIQLGPLDEDLAVEVRRVRSRISV